MNELPEIIGARRAAQPADNDDIDDFFAMETNV